MFWSCWPKEAWGWGVCVCGGFPHGADTTGYTCGLCSPSISKAGPSLHSLKVLAKGVVGIWATFSGGVYKGYTKGYFGRRL